MQRGEVMKFRLIARGILAALIMVALAAAISTCGGRDRTSRIFQSAAGTQANIAHSRAITLDDALTELDALPAPNGVKHEVFQQIKDALAKALRAKGLTKVISTPPTGAANEVNDLSIIDNDNGTFSLSWRYRNLGDYNQDGVVSVADITPLAMHIGEEWSVGGENTLPAVIDGSQNNKVDIADVTQIAMYFGTECPDYSIRIADTYPNIVDDTTVLDTTPIAQEPPTERRLFSYSFSSPPGIYVAVAPLDGAETPGDLSNVVQTINHNPTASLIADVAEGDVPLTVNFDASGCSDSDGEIVSYHWDYEGDGDYDETTTEPLVSHVYEASGDFRPTLRINDDCRGYGYAQVAVSVYSPPVAAISANPTGGTVRLTVNFDAGDSYDPDGNIVKYEWDRNGDGWFELDTGVTPTCSYTYRNRGEYEATVRVTDNDGRTATASFPVTAVGGEWVHTWGTSDNQSGGAPIIDNEGNIVIGTYVTVDYVPYNTILRYNADGKVIGTEGWRMDSACSVADMQMDSAGNLYSAGQVVMPSNHYNASLVKFDSAGNFCWAKTWGGDEKETAEAISITGDGSVYVVGDTWSFGTIDDMGVDDVLVLKYDPDGNLIWARTWGLFEEQDIASDAVADSGGNLYIVGSTTDSEHRDVLLLKYSPDGDLIWQEMWSSPNAEAGFGASLDANGNLLVTGMNDANGAGGIDVLLLKLDPMGNVIWQYSWSGSGSEKGHDVNVASDGTIYVSGEIHPDKTLDWQALLFKVDTDGQLIWQRQWGDVGEQKGTGLAIGDGVLYVTGIAPDIYAEWQDAAMVPAACDGSIIGLAGYETIPIGSESSPNVMIMASPPTGAQDEGGGQNDALVMEVRI
jgi:PKD repeat protein